MLRTIGVIVIGLMITATLGCGGGGAEPLPTVKVTGTVTLDGSPVDGARVVFNPTSAEGMAASGVTDDAGKYELTTRDPGDGALPGTYLVMISKTEQEGGSTGSEAIKPGMSDEEATEAAMEAYVAGGEQDPTHKELLPTKYTSPSTSGLQADVSESNTEFNFELTSE